MERNKYVWDLEFIEIIHLISLRRRRKIIKHIKGDIGYKNLGNDKRTVYFQGDDINSPEFLEEIEMLKSMFDQNLISFEINKI